MPIFGGLGKLFGRFTSRQVPSTKDAQAAQQWAGNVNNWLLTGRWEAVNSSNVAAIAYDASQQWLMIRYHDGSEWVYSPIIPTTAAGLYLAKSKGTWVWDYLRVRGRGNAHLHQVGAARMG